MVRGCDGLSWRTLLGIRPMHARLQSVISLFSHKTTDTSSTWYPQSKPYMRGKIRMFPKLLFVFSTEFVKKDLFVSVVHEIDGLRTKRRYKGQKKPASGQPDYEPKLTLDQPFIVCSVPDVLFHNSLNDQVSTDWSIADSTAFTNKSTSAL